MKTDSPFHKILIVQTAFIGDVVLTLPLVQELAKRYPKSEIHFLAIPISRNLLETVPEIHRLWILDKRNRDKGVVPFLKFVARLREEHFQVALLPHRSFRSAFLAYQARIPRRIGFSTGSGAFLYSDKVPYQQHIHEIERNLSLLEPLGYRSNHKVFPRLYPTSSDRERVDSWLKEKGISPAEQLAILAPGSIWPTKRWPAAYWGKLILLLEKIGVRSIIIGSKDDRFLLKAIQESAEGHRILECMGYFTLRQTAELMSRACLVVSNDSAPTHLGVAMRVPVLTIFGPTVPRFGFYPYGENDRIAEITGLSCRPCGIHGGRKCPEKHFKCMRDLHPERVFKIAQEMIYENCEH